MGSRQHIVEIGSGDTLVGVDVTTGGRIAQITVDGRPLLWDGRPSGAIGWGSYPMAPWAGRLRDGRFDHAGTTYQLQLNHEDGDGSRHAIHGTVFSATWTVDAAAARSVELHCDLRSSLGWPFAGRARQRISLEGSALRCELAVESDGETFPAAIGWHPWFLKPDRLGFEPSAMYRRDAIGLPAADLVEPVPGPWDDTFVNTEPVTLHYADPGRTVTVTSDCDHWVVFDQPAHATCVEPQSGPPDALTMQPRLVEPGRPLQRWMQIAWA